MAVSACKPLGSERFDMTGWWSLWPLLKTLCCMVLIPPRHPIVGSKVGNSIFLYSWDSAALRALLDARADILTAAGWPTDPTGFVRHCIEHFAPV